MNARTLPFRDSRSYLLRGIPLSLWRRFRAKCTRQGTTMRLVILQLVLSYVSQKEEE